jgi:zinc D-Ala-D-Ala dipeptidase
LRERGSARPATGIVAVARVAAALVAALALSSPVPSGADDSAAPRATASSAAAGAPIVRSTPALVWIREVAPLVVEDIRYATPRNFVGRRIDGYEAAKCLLTPAAAAAVAKAQAALASRDLRLVVWDCYRPERAVADFVRWARDLADTATKSEYYPDVPKDELFARGYIAEKSGHSRGSTLDVGLLRRDATTDRFVPVDMGTAYDFFDPRSHTDAPGTSPDARRKRDLLRDALASAGFVNLPEEWWHYTLANEPYPETTFDVPVR